MVVARQRQRWRSGFGNVAARVESHLRDDWRGAVLEMERAEAMRVAGLQFTVDRKDEAEAAKVQRKQILDRVENTRMGGSERVLDLFDGRCYLGRVERQAAADRKIIP